MAEQTVVAEGPDALVRRVEALAARVDALPDAEARAAAQKLLGAVLDLYGEGLARIVRSLPGATAEALARDPVVASLLLVHGLHPVPLGTRVRGALDSVRPYLTSHGGDVELVALEDGVARLRLTGSCDGCPASASTLELAIEQALEEAARTSSGSTSRARSHLRRG
jgi:Fe-S cluster biogenesis protein NfuA